MYNIISVPLFVLIIYNTSKIDNKFVLKIASSSPIQYLSKISFAFFLAQFFSFDIIKYLLSFSWFNNHKNIKMILLSLLINLLISILMHEAVEKPSKKILTHLYL
jgi:peptidoglycan/LPS O-acetylase OafA/YrhL